MLACVPGANDFRNKAQALSVWKPSFTFPSFLRPTASNWVALLRFRILWMPMVVAMREDVLSVSEVFLLKVGAICQGFIDVESVGAGPHRSGVIVANVGGQTTQIVTLHGAIISVPPLLQNV